MECGCWIWGIEDEREDSKVVWAVIQIQWSEIGKFSGAGRSDLDDNQKVE